VHGLGLAFYRVVHRVPASIANDQWDAPAPTNVNLHGLRLETPSLLIGRAWRQPPPQSFQS
jgi:hypothetical protein